MKSAENILKLKNELEATLGHINDEYDRGNSELLDAIHEQFTVNINGQTVSLGSMDAYDLFQQFLAAAAECAEELDLELDTEHKLQLADLDISYIAELDITVIFDRTTDDCQFINFYHGQPDDSVTETYI